MIAVGVDTGGTFTDIIGDDGSVRKVLSTPTDPSRAIEEGLGKGFEAGGGRHHLLTHGTTVATNALLERKGAEVSLITTRGFGDVIEIARQDRPSLYDQCADRPEPLVPRDRRFEIAGRLDATGAEIEGVSPDDLPRPPTHAVAICLIHSDLNPAHELAVASAPALAGHDLSLSVEVSPEFREYERTVTTVINAYLRPICGNYMNSLGALADEVLVMSSAGGLITADEAAALPAALLLSGPAGGVRAGAMAAAAAGYPNCVTFDMGGTSTDVCLVLHGMPEPAALRLVGGFPVRLPSLDIHTIGAGGGSLAAIDSGGALRVGPESAGAEPGPACYSRGGASPTVTDANLLLGRIPPESDFPGLGRLDLEAARRATERAGIAPEGVIAVVNANMEQAIRKVTVERGHDPRDFALVAFGGAGPLHACELATALNMPAVIIPPRAGVLSAAGILTSPRSRELVRSWARGASTDGLAIACDQLGAEAESLVPNAVRVETFLDCRYEGQSHELTVTSVGEFHEEHLRRNGYSRPESPVEIVAIRGRASAAPSVVFDSLPPVKRGGGEGPSVVSEPDCTVWLPEGWTARVHQSGSWILTKRS